MASTFDSSIESQIGEWRTFLLRRRTIHPVDVEELEDHLRSEISELGVAGLSGDESFLVAIKRLGGINELSREFARERSSRLWKQLVLAGDGVRDHSIAEYRELFITICLAIGAALACKLPAAFGINFFSASTSDSASMHPDASFYLLNASLLTLPFLIGFFAWKRTLSLRSVVALTVPFIIAALLVNAFPFQRGGDSEVLAAIHLPIVLWLVAGVAYLDGSWRSDAPRMDFVRFTGEWFIYYTLVALGGVVFVGLTAGLFEAINLDATPIIQSWLLPCSAAGAIVVVAWLVEAKQSVIENMAPVLTGIFTPLFALMLVVAIVAMALTGNFIDPDRDVLILLDVLLVVVLGLVLYSFSARDPATKPSLMDAVHLVLVMSALAVDVLALVSILSRITEFGFTPNRTAGLGLNLVLLANLTWSAWLLSAFLRGRRPFSDLERWQTTYIPVYGAWAAIVVIVFPPLFAFA
ncbi:MAG TPA: permease prefix domain 1-containing protein [Dehalococcoidia bacterium]|nr:permease prefix domain 1-containing protein [Dehalococcoidia bacterium]